MAQVAPVYVEGQVQVLGAEQVPPFKQADEHTATQKEACFSFNEQQ